jgi:4-hydroxy-3-polyprenylbenzoate decarboxylase
LKGGEAGGLEKFEPKRVRQAPCQQVVQLGGDVDLTALPAGKSWPDESAPAITGGQLTAWDEPSGRRIWQSCLLPVVERNRLALPLTPFDPLAPVWKEAKRRRQKLPVAIVLGGNPPAMLLATMPEVVSVDPFALAGFWSGEAMQVAPCRTQPLEVPATAEIVLEGVLDPLAGQVDAGQFVVPGGFYQPLSDCLNIEITAITQRTNAAFPTVIHGPPPSETTALDQLAERMLLPVARRAAPEVVDLAIPGYGGRHDYLYVSIRKRYARQARKVASALWGLEGLMLTKTIVLVDAAVDVHNTSAVLREVGANVLPGRDVFFADGPAHPFDRAGAVPPHAAKLGIDATSKLPDEGPDHWPRAAAPDPGIEKLLQGRWEEYGLDLPPPS